MWDGLIQLALPSSIDSGSSSSPVRKDTVGHEGSKPSDRTSPKPYIPSEQPPPPHSKPQSPQPGYKGCKPFPNSETSQPSHTSPKSFVDSPRTPYLSKSSGKPSYPAPPPQPYDPSPTHFSSLSSEPSTRPSFHKPDPPPQSKQSSYLPSLPSKSPSSSFKPGIPLAPLSKQPSYFSSLPSEPPPKPSYLEPDPPVQSNQPSYFSSLPSEPPPKPSFLKPDPPPQSKQPSYFSSLPSEPPKPSSLKPDPPLPPLLPKKTSYLSSLSSDPLHHPRNYQQWVAVKGLDLSTSRPLSQSVSSLSKPIMSPTINTASPDVHRRSVVDLSTWALGDSSKPVESLDDITIPPPVSFASNVPVYPPLKIDKHVDPWSKYKPSISTCDNTSTSSLPREDTIPEEPPPVCYATLPKLPSSPSYSLAPSPNACVCYHIPNCSQGPRPSVSSHCGVLSTVQSPTVMVAYSFPRVASPNFYADSLHDHVSGGSHLMKKAGSLTAPSPPATAPSAAVAAPAPEASAPTSPSPPQKQSVSEKMKFFEKAMEESHQPSPKPEKVFSFLSQDEIERMKQEEDKKIASLTRSDVKTWSHLSERDEEEDDDDEYTKREDTNKEEEEEDKSRSEGGLSDNQTRQSPSFDTPVRTAKAERRRKERLMQEGLLDEEDKDLSPAEERALRAEKRAAWRQARFKSLEQDALQAQMVIKKMSEMIDGESSKNVITSTSTLKSTEETDSLAVDNNNVEDTILNKRTFTHHETNTEPRSTLLRPSSADFPKLAVRSQDGQTKVRESERLLDEKVTRKTEEYVDETSGEVRVRTVEYIEKLIEKEVETTREKIISLELCSPEKKVHEMKTEEIIVVKRVVEDEKEEGEAAEKDVDHPEDTNGEEKEEEEQQKEETATVPTGSSKRRRNKRNNKSSK